MGIQLHRDQELSLSIPSKKFKSWIPKFKYNIYKLPRTIVLCHTKLKLMVIENNPEHRDRLPNKEVQTERQLEQKKTVYKLLFSFPI